MKLRLRYPHIQDSVVLDVSPTMLLDDFHKKVIEQLPDRNLKYQLQIGFPPQEVNGKGDEPIKNVFEDASTVTVHPVEWKDYQAQSTKPVPISLRNDTISRSFRTLHPTNKISTPLKRRKRAKDVAILGNHESEWIENLVNLFSQTKNLNAAQKALKGAFKNAVQRRHRSTLAEHRWAAAQGTTYMIRNLKNNMQFEVTFSTGKRTKITEKYLCIPKPLLGAILMEAHNSGEEAKHNLRPYYLSEAQPLVFWNLVRYFGGDIESAYSQLAPDIDWAYIRDRKRNLSEKALENIKQQADQKALMQQKKRMKHVPSSPSSSHEITKVASNSHNTTPVESNNL